ncbi:MAG: hypothetical protein J0653_01375, partial [Deltaproteobacteria bacterium]|nr:hypothetical protein [Deltaproteobacteria bacterium]
MAALGLWGARRSGSLLIGAFFGVNSYGFSAHAIYFMMQRTDALAIALGVGSILCLWWRLSLVEKVGDYFGSLPLWRILCAAGLATFAALTKQTAIVFLPLAFLPGLFVLAGRKWLAVLNFFFAALLAAAIVGLYILLVNPDVLRAYQYGLEIYSREHSGNILKYHLDAGFYPHYFMQLAVAAFFALTCARRVKKSWFAFFGLAALVIGLALYKTWGNGAAFNNNFIMSALFATLLFFAFWPYWEKVERTLGAGLFLFLSLQSFAFGNGTTY